VTWKGDIAAGVAILAEVPAKAQTEPEIIMAWVNARVLERKWDEALALLDKTPRPESGADTDWTMLHDGHLIFRGMLHHTKGQTEIARGFLEQARQQLQGKIATAPGYAKLHGSLGQVLAYLGDKAGAIAAAERAMQLLPASVDAFDGPMITVMAAQTFGLVGENDRALALLDQLLTTPNGVSLPSVQLDPMWDTLRDDPRFEQLLTKHAARS
jgi:serine/threonine-protein kinase